MAQIAEKYEWFSKLPGGNIPWELMLSRCLTGQYSTLFGTLDDVPVGFICFEDRKPTVFIIGLYGPNKIKHFYDLVFETFRTQGYNYVKAASAFPTEAYERLTGFKKLYSIYGRDI